MNLKNTCRALLTLIGASLLSVSLISPASAARGVSQGHGVKCYWVVVSSDPPRVRRCFSTCAAAEPEPCRSQRRE
jgi:hypothetical protein